MNISKKQLLDFVLQLHKCNHLFSTRENGTLESPYLPAGNSVTSPNHHQFLNEMDSTPVKQTNSFSRNTKGKILVCSLNCGFPKKPFIMNAPMWVEHLLITFWWMQHSKPTKKWWLRCLTHKGAFIINDFLRNPHFNWWSLQIFKIEEKGR